MHRVEWKLESHLFFVECRSQIFDCLYNYILVVFVQNLAKRYWHCWKISSSRVALQSCSNSRSSVSEIRQTVTCRLV